MASLAALDFRHYREVGLDIWGEHGRLSILNEGLGIYVCPREPNRAMENEKELRYEKFQRLKSTVGQALYHIYDNLAQAIRNGTSLWSSGQSAFKTMAVVEAVRDSAKCNNISIELNQSVKRRDHVTVECPDLC